MWSKNFDSSLSFHSNIFTWTQKTWIQCRNHESSAWKLDLLSRHSLKVSQWIHYTNHSSSWLAKKGNYIIDTPTKEWEHRSNCFISQEMLIQETTFGKSKNCSYSHLKLMFGRVSPCMWIIAWVKIKLKPKFIFWWKQWVRK